VTDPVVHRAIGAAALRVVALLAWACTAVMPAGAQQAPLPMPQDTRLVVFRYDPNDTYLLLTRPGAVTHLALEPGESVVALALGDTVQWIVQDKGPHVFVKPVRPDLYTSGTLVTNRRTYQLGLRSSPEGGAWYQRVSWTSPDLIALQRDPAAGDDAGRGPNDAHSARVARKGDAPRATVEGVQVDRLNFDYRIQGAAAFRPSQVFDDGRFTYVRMPASLQEMPALFVGAESGASEEGQLVNYTLRGRLLVVHRLADRFVLRLGAATVRVERVQPLDTVAQSWATTADHLHGDLP
jgi:P-type conjugative transfer protein TrbG